VFSINQGSLLTSSLALQKSCNAKDQALAEAQALMAAFLNHQT
jgi:hypothetical protein